MATPAHGTRKPSSFVKKVDARPGGARPTVAPEVIEAAIWALTKNNRIGLAHNIAQCADQLHPSRFAHLASALRGLALSPHVVSSMSPAVEWLADLKAANIEAAEDDSEPLALLLFAHALRPALLAHASGAQDVLRAVNFAGELGALNDLRQRVVAYAESGLDLSLSVLKGIREHARWVERGEALRRDAQIWLGERRAVPIKFHAANAVWQRWFRDDNIFGSKLLDVILDRREKRREVEQFVESWTDNQIEHQMHRHDEELRGRKRARIEPPTDKVFLERTREGLGHMRAWLDYLRLEPDSAEDFHTKKADEVRRGVLDTLGKGRDGVKRWADRPNRPERAAAAAAAERAHADLARIFDPDVQEPARPLEPHEALDAELLQLDEVLTEGWESERDPSDVLPDLLRIAHGPGPDWPTIFHRRSEAYDHRATRRIIRLLERDPGMAETAQRLEAEREKGLEKARRVLQKGVDDTQKRIDTAVTQDLLPESLKNELEQRVASVAPRSKEGSIQDERLDFPGALAILETVKKQIESQREERAKEVEQRVAKIRNQLKDDVYARVRAALDARDLGAANEYIDLAQNGEELPPATTAPDPFDKFFPTFAEAMRRHIEGPPARDTQQLIKEARSGTIGPLRTADPQASKEAGDLLDAWFKLKTGRIGAISGTVGGLVKTLFEQLGFRVGNVRELGATHPGVPIRGMSFDVTTDLVTDRSLCPIPRFGSMANGRYRVVCSWGLYEDDFYDIAGKEPDVALVVLFLDRMSVARRRALAEQCRTRRRTFVLLDELLVCYLAATPGRRLGPFFECSLPFTVADTYTTTSSHVPVEMFYGRKRELDQVFDRNGTGLLFGGRQLGKTVLLKEVERRHHRPEKGVYVKWIDLKEAAIGYTKPVEDLWRILGQHLQELGVFKSTYAQRDSILKALEDWLRNNPEKRILFLLDEADKFLEQDSKIGFEHLTKLKGLVEKTGLDRRFKVVFAGLHNVQRTARDVNTSIAHLGRPICIGPLLDDGEWRESLRLVEEPLKALGYRFETRDLPMRILSHTNYYPSLIQIFCQKLLEHLSSRNKIVFDFTSSAPPYTIKSKHIDDAYKSQELRDVIRQKFMLTLDLDPRYKLIALCIAFYSSESLSEGGIVGGFDAPWIRQRALYWWDKGFKTDSSQEAFRTILEEMVGLGVLRRCGEHGERYALRSPNVLTLMGTREEIEARLMDAAMSEPPPEYDAATFRRRIGIDADKAGWLRSPITSKQEMEILAPRSGISVAHGCRASELDNIEEYLNTVESGRLEVAEATTLDAFADELKAFLDKRHDGISPFLVSWRMCPWDETWVESALDLVLGLRSTGKWARIIFLSPPSITWRWVQKGREVARRLAGHEGSSELQLRPWHDAAVRQWLEDTGFKLDYEQQLQEMRATAGNWGGLLHQIALEARKTPHRFKEVFAARKAELGSKPLGWWTKEMFEIADLHEPLSVLKTIADLDPDPVALDDLLSLVALPRETVEDTLRWADLQSFVRADETGWRLDPIVKRCFHDGAPKT